MATAHPPAVVLEYDLQLVPTQPHHGGPLLAGHLRIDVPVTLEDDATLTLDRDELRDALAQALRTAADDVLGHTPPDATT